MTRSLVVCLAASVSAAALAAMLCIAAGGGWLAALALYSATGSLTLVGLTLAGPMPERAASRPAQAGATRFA